MIARAIYAAGAGVVVLGGAASLFGVMCLGASPLRRRLPKWVNPWVLVHLFFLSLIVAVVLRTTAVALDPTLGGEPEPP